jgi:hypothetical protein
MAAGRGINPVRAAVEAMESGGSKAFHSCWNVIAEFSIVIKQAGEGSPTSTSMISEPVSLADAL